MGVERYALVDDDGAVRNIVVWDAKANPDWTPPYGWTARPDDGTPMADAAADATPAPPTLEEKIAAVIEAISALVDDRSADAADAIATVTDEGAAP